jgi:catechol 2,3-dioxygenase-like lactoylglutathione lyase family enzyme
MHSLLNLNHINIVTNRVAETVRFYEEVVGLKSKKRPNFPNDGAWLYLGDRALVHVNLQINDEQMLGTSEGSLSHYAFQIDDMDELRDHLKKLCIEYEEWGVPGTEMWQVFVKDPNNIDVEFLHIPVEDQFFENLK